MPLPLVLPMLASSGAVPSSPAGRSFDLKSDGWRPLVCVDGRGVEVRTGTGRKVSDSLPELVGLVDALDVRTAILDGGVNASRDGRTDWYRLTPRMAHTG